MRSSAHEGKAESARIDGVAERSIPVRVGTFSIVPVLSREEFDAIEFGAAFSGEHEAAAQRMSRLAVTGTQTPSMPRAEAFLRAGEQWLLADDPAAAASGFRLALADGGPVFVDPRVPLSRALFLLGKSGEALGLISQLKAEGRQDPRMCDLVAELLVERGDLPEALDWATAGVELCLRREAAGPDSSSGPGEPASQDGDATGQDPALSQDRALSQDHAAGQNAATGPDPAGPGRVVPVQAVPNRATASPADDDPGELRLLLSLRYRIRMDLGMAEDDYDRLLDEAPPAAGTGTAGSRTVRAVSESDA
jgi:hypothetical protein